MRATLIKISNLLGIQDLEFEPGTFTIVSGPNGSGKTSVLESIKSIMKGGEDATLLRHGSKAGEIVMVFDDETQVKKRVTAKSTTLTVERDGAMVKSPQLFIRQLTDMFSVNPVDFLDAKPKDRLRVLLESLPLVSDAARLSEIVGFEVKDAPDQHALTRIDAIQKAVYDSRTGTNRAIRDKTVTISQLKQTLPPSDTDEDVGTADFGVLNGLIETADRVRDAEIKRLSDKLATFKASSDGQISFQQAQIEEAKNTARDQIEAIRNAERIAVDEANRLIEVQRDTYRDAERRAGLMREKALGIHTEDVTPIKMRIIALQTAAGEVARAAQTRETIRKMEADLDELQGDEARQTLALQGLEDYKAEMLNSLPITGLEVRDDAIYRDGVIFDRLNTAQQVEIAVEIAKLRAGELGIICVDGLENLDTAHFEAFEQQAIASGLQVIVSRVSDETFNVKTN